REGGRGVRYMTIIITEVANREQALAIAQSLPNSFTDEGLAEMKVSLQEEIAFGAYDGQELAGFATYKALNEVALELTWLAVLPDYQGSGVGTQLVTETLERLRGSYKICTVKTLAETHPDPGYQKTRAFYRRLGFISIETIQPYPGWLPDNPCQIFVKCL
ncbi:MAG: GNAT family N-acetyltransferase, partial [Dehalococcoidia bacterium]